MAPPDDSSSLSKKLRNAEKGLVKGLIRWRINAGGLPPLNEQILDRGTDRLLDQAHSLVKERTTSILEDLKLARDEFRKAYRGDDQRHENEQS